MKPWGWPGVLLAWDLGPTPIRESLQERTQRNYHAKDSLQTRVPLWRTLDPPTIPLFQLSGKSRKWHLENHDNLPSLTENDIINSPEYSRFSASPYLQILGVKKKLEIVSEIADAKLWRSAGEKLLGGWTGWTFPGVFRLFRFTFRFGIRASSGQFYSAKMPHLCIFVSHVNFTYIHS